MLARITTVPRVRCSVRCMMLAEGEVKRPPLFCFTTASILLFLCPYHLDIGNRPGAYTNLVNYVGKASSPARQIQILGFGVVAKGLWVVSIVRGRLYIHIGTYRHETHTFREASVSRSSSWYREPVASATIPTLSTYTRCMRLSVIIRTTPRLSSDVFNAHNILRTLRTVSFEDIAPMIFQLTWSRFKVREMYFTRAYLSK